MLRQSVAQANRGGQGKKELVITTICDDISWRGTAGPITQWAKEVWDSSVRLESPQTLSLPTLREAWHAVAFPTAWSKVRGQSAPQPSQWLGWKWTGPFTFTDHRGTARQLTSTSPAYVAQLAKQAYDGDHTTCLASDLGCPGQAVNMYVPRQLQF